MAAFERAVWLDKNGQNDKNSDIKTIYKRGRLTEEFINNAHIERLRNVPPFAYSGSRDPEQWQTRQAAQ